MQRKITLNSDPFNLAGRILKEGDPAPEFYATDFDLQDVRSSVLNGSVRVITSLLSLDTPVCDAHVKKFNDKAKELSDDIKIIAISQDLPFAQKRFCVHNRIDDLKMLSDYKTNSFGINYGLLIKELGLLARAVAIIDGNDVIRYFSIVEEVTGAPDYDDAFAALENVMKNHRDRSLNHSPARCIPCHGGISPLGEDRSRELIAGLKGWNLVEGKKITKPFKFKDFVEALYFVDLIGVTAEEQGHHPEISISYNRVTITLSTYAIGGLSDNDFIMADMIDALNL